MVKATASLAYTHECLINIQSIILLSVSQYNSNFMTLSNNTNGLKFRSYQTFIDIQAGFVNGKVCNIPFDITLAGLTEKPYAFLINSCSQNGRQIRYDWDLSTKTVAIASIEFDAQLPVGTTIRLGIIIVGK